MAKHKIADKTLRLFEDILRILEPPKPLTVSEWAAEHRVLSGEACAEPGRWNLGRAMYQNVIMDAISDRTCVKIILMTSGQVGKTEIILNTIGYYSHHDPAPILFVNPKESMAKDISKDRLAPMIRDTKCLKEVYGMAKSRDSDNTILHKKFPGGHVTLIGSNSPADLSSRPIRILLLDEVDRYPVSAGTEGDPVDLAVKRTNNFWNKKIVMASTPTEKGLSRIEKEYKRSSMEEWCVQCPYCGMYTPYVWENLDFNDMMMQCDCCGEKLTENEWKSRPGAFVAKNPEETRTRGFHLNEMASPWVRWEKIVDDFLSAKQDMKENGSDEKMRTWVNTSKGLPYEASGYSADQDELMKRREYYRSELPDGVLVITAAVDVQDNRFEIEVCGWGRGYESWGILYHKIFGNLEQDGVWEELDDFLQREFYFENGNSLGIACTFIDTGGHYTTETYKWLAKMMKKHRNIFGIKGYGKNGIPLLHQKSTNNDYNVPILILGVNAGKETVMKRLNIKKSKAGYCHFPENIDRGYDKKYMDGITSEKRVIKPVRGKLSIVWVKKSGVRNEPLDLRNYNTAAIEFLNPDFSVLEKKVQTGVNYLKKPKRTRQRQSGVISRGLYRDGGV